MEDRCFILLILMVMALTMLFAGVSSVVSVYTKILLIATQNTSKYAKNLQLIIKLCQVYYILIRFDKDNVFVYLGFARFVNTDYRYRVDDVKTSKVSSIAVLLWHPDSWLKKHLKSRTNFDGVSERLTVECFKQNNSQDVIPYTSLVSLTRKIPMHFTVSC